jgi:hypothetical protein
VSVDFEPLYNNYVMLVVKLMNSFFSSSMNFYIEYELESL